MKNSKNNNIILGFSFMYLVSVYPTERSFETNLGIGLGLSKIMVTPIIGLSYLSQTFHILLLFLLLLYLIFMYFSQSKNINHHKGRFRIL